MTEEITEDITLGDLAHVFFEGHNVDNVRFVDDGDVCFDVREHDPGAAPGRRIKGSDLEDIRRFFTYYLQTRPYANQMLQVLWIREVEFAMGALRKDDMCDFLLRAFEFYGLLIDEEELEYEFFDLLEDGYLLENDLGFVLSPKGKRFAEEMFKMMTTLISNSTEAPSVDRDDVIANIRELVSAVNRLALPVVPGTENVTNSNVTQSHPEGKAKKKRRSKAARRGVLEEAIDYQEEHPSMTDDEIVKMFGLERGALSKKHAIYLKEKRERERQQQRDRLVSRKVGEDLLHHNLGMSRR